MREIQSYSYRVQPNDVDLTRRISIISLGNYILHAAGEDADKLGVGVRLLNNDNVTWVLSRMAIEVARYLDQYEDFRIETWVESVNRLITTRNFVVYDSADREVAASTTNWAMIDLGTRRAVDLSLNVDYAECINATKCPIEKPAKVTEVKGDVLSTIFVRYSDLDFNEHANTMKYIEWMIDLLPLSKMVGNKLQRIDLNFLQEMRYGDQGQIIHKTNPDGNDLFEIIKSDSCSACRSIFRWI